MTRHAAALLAPLAVLLLTLSNVTAEGVRYHWTLPGISFGSPVSISDRDESPRSGTTIRLTFPRADLPGDRTEAVLNMEFDVQENPSLGYSYGGFAIPFPSPVQATEDGEVAFLIQSEAAISSFQIVLRDQDLRRSTHTMEVESSDEWTAGRIPLEDFDPPVVAALESIAFVVLGAESGTLRVAELRLPVQTETTALSAVSQVHLRPKWYSHQRMAELVAEHRETPLLVITSPTREGGNSVAELLEHDESWRPLLRQTTNLLVTDSDSTTPRLTLYAPDGRLMVRSHPHDPDAFEVLASALGAEAED